MEFLKSIKKVIYYNIKISCSVNFLAAIALIALVPFIFSLRMLGTREIAVIGEMYLSIIGIILFTFIVDIEERDNIKETIFSRKTPYVYIFILRIFILMILAFLLIAIITLYACYNGGSFSIWGITAGIWVSAVFLGLLGLTISNVTGNITSGYIGAFAYYLFELVTKGKYTRSFYLFSLLNNSLNEKYRILIITAIILGFNIACILRKS